jgi:hypothetical protein
MSIYGDLFDFQASAMVFECLTLGFMATYGLVAVWSAGRAQAGNLGPLQSA